MAHIFGIPHSIGGIIDAFGFGANAGGGGNFFVDPPGGGFDADDVDGIGEGPPYPIVPSGGSCAPCGPKTQRYITTVCPDGSIKTRPHKSRRRRRRLASVSDIKDIAALKQVFGGGKAFETWIATRGR